MINMFEFFLEALLLISFASVIYIFNFKIKRLESGQNDLKEIKKLLFDQIGTTIKKVSKNETQKVFYREWPDGSKMKISFITLGGPIIAIDIPEGSKYEKEIDEHENLFRLKKLNNEVENLLKEKGFTEDTDNYNGAF